MFKPKGIITPIVTPMTEDEKINEGELRTQVNRLIACGINGIFALGTNGEVYALTTEEKLEIIRIVVDETKGRVPVYAGTGCISTRETIWMSRQAQKLGVDVLSIISPYFVAVSQDDIYRHYSAIAEAVDLPIVLYNIPARTGKQYRLYDGPQARSAREHRRHQGQQRKLRQHPTVHRGHRSPIVGAGGKRLPHSLDAPGRRMRGHRGMVERLPEADREHLHFLGTREHSGGKPAADQHKAATGHHEARKSQFRRETGDESPGLSGRACAGTRWRHESENRRGTAKSFCVL